MKKYLFPIALLIFFLVGLFLFTKPLSVELKIDSKLKNQAGFSKKTTQVLSYLKKYKNQFLWQIPLKQIVQNIEQMSLGLDVSAYRKYPNQLIVSLNEKKTALLLLKGDSYFYSVSYDGSLGVKKQTQNIIKAPILRGTSFETEKDLRKEVLQLLELIPKDGQVFSIENISEIHYDKKQSSFLTYLSTRPLAINLNSPLRSQTIKNIEFVLEYLEKEEQKYSLIDARTEKKIIVKKKI